MKYLKNTVLIVAMVLGSLALTYPVFASSLPVGVSQFFLSGAGVTSSATNIQLTSMQTPDGRLVTMSMFGTIGYGALEPQTTAKIEDISFTGITQNANGTATLTGVSRGLDFVFPYASTGSLQKSHAGGATFIITNTAGFYYNEFTMNNNNNLFTYPTASTSPATKGYVDAITTGNYFGLSANNTASGNNIFTGNNSFTGINTFSNTTSVPYSQASSSAASVGYANALTFAGAPNANTTTKGIVQEATQTQSNNGTQVGSTGAELYVNPSTLAGTITALVHTSTFYFATSSTDAIVQIPVLSGDTVQITSVAAHSGSSCDTGSSGYSTNYNWKQSHFAATTTYAVGEQRSSIVGCTATTLYQATATTTETWNFETKPNVGFDYLQVMAQKLH